MIMTHTITRARVASGWVAAWTDKPAPGCGAVRSAWVPKTYSEAVTTLISELSRNLGRWSSTGTRDRYQEALDALTAARGAEPRELAFDLPRHVLVIRHEHPHA